MGFIGSAKGIQQDRFKKQFHDKQDSIKNEISKNRNLYFESPDRGNLVTVLNYFQSLREELQDCPMKLGDLQNEEISKLLRKLTKGKTVKTSKADGEPANSVELRIILPKRAKA